MMDRIELKYGCNPDQGNAGIYREGGLPLEVLNGRPGYINLLDALNGWQLASMLKGCTGLSAAASFKHVSPAGAAVAVPLDEDERRMYFASGDLSPLATAYVRARGADRMSSFGDFIALSDICDVSTASVIAKEVSDGIIAPGYEPEALAILMRKRKGAYTILSIDPEYRGGERDSRTVFGIEFTQDPERYAPSMADLGNPVTKLKDIPKEAVLDMMVALASLRFTQSNSVCYAYRGQTIGVGAGQQSRLHCTRLAGGKADLWHLRRSERVLSLPFRPGLTRNEKDNIIEQYLSDDPEIDVVSDWKGFFTRMPERMEREEKKAILASIHGVSLASDAFFPFADNIIRASRSGVSYISQPGGSMRDDLAIEAADRAGIVMFMTGRRLFTH